LSRRQLQNIFGRMTSATGLARRGIHSLRHTYATFLYRASGGNLRLVQKQLGHARITTTQVYADVLDEDAQEALERLYRRKKQ
jgi:integrase